MKIGPFYTLLDRRSQDWRQLKLFKPPPCPARAPQRKYGCMGHRGHWKCCFMGTLWPRKDPQVQRECIAGQQLCLTRCMAELRGGWGSMSNCDGVCPKFCICASMACGQGRGTVMSNMRQGERSTHCVTMQAYPKSAMKKVQKIHPVLSSQAADSSKC